MLLPRLLGPLGQLFISASLALPKRKCACGIGRGLINRALRRDDFSAATRTTAPARGAPLDIDIQELRLIVHGALALKLYPPASCTPLGMPSRGPRPAGGSDLIRICDVESPE